MSDPHHELRMLLGAFALGDVTDNERAAVTAHLDGCAACRAEVADLRPLVARLAQVDVEHLDDSPVVPPDLEEAVITRIATAHRAGATTATERRGRRLASAAVGVAAATAAAIGFVVAWNVRPDPPTGPLEAVSVRAIDTDLRDLSADVVPHTWGLEVKLEGTGFDAGEVYRVVVLRSDGTSAPAGEFIGVGDAPMDCNLNSSVLRDDAAGFDVVDAQGTVVLTSSF